jgi:hypothetical protein
MQARIFGFSIRVDNAGGHLGGEQSAVYDVIPGLNRAGARRKHERAMGATNFPFSERVGHQRRKWDDALPAIGLRLADLVVAIGPLRNMQFVPF